MIIKQFCMNNIPPDQALLPEKKKIIKATVIAWLVAIVILLTTILPAEYGIDPTGIGKALGFTRLSATKTEQSTVSAGNHSESIKYREDTISVTIEPFTGIEYKFKVNERVSMLYSWTADGRLAYDFHGDTQGMDASSSTTTSYDKSENTKGHGSFVAPFTGRHGWWWANYTNKPVTVTLTTVGFYEIIGDPNKVSQ
jgi:hypothetical protein